MIKYKFFSGRNFGKFSILLTGLLMTICFEMNFPKQFVVVVDAAAVQQQNNDIHHQHQQQILHSKMESLKVAERMVDDDEGIAADDDEGTIDGDDGTDVSMIPTDTILNDEENSQREREHKLHNIVLYPDKHSWCTALSIKQVISHPGCQSIEINNTVCVGACFSYAIPNVEPSDPGEIILPYCDSCQPSDTIWKHITLECDPLMMMMINDVGQQQSISKHSKSIEIIKDCSCNSCDKLKSSQSQSPSSLMTSKSKSGKSKIKKSLKKTLGQFENLHKNQSSYFIDNNDIDNNNNDGNNNQLNNDDLDDDLDDDSDDDELPDILTAVHNFTINSTKSKDVNNQEDNDQEDGNQHDDADDDDQDDQNDNDDDDKFDHHHNVAAAAAADKEHFNTIQNLKKHKIVHLIRQIQAENLQLDKMELMKVLSLLRNSLRNSDDDKKQNKKLNTNRKDADADADGNSVNSDLDNDKIINEFIENLKIDNKSMEDILNEDQQQQHSNSNPHPQPHPNSNSNPPNPHPHPNPHHHSLGEHIGNGHLIKGPHGALVIEHDHEKNSQSLNSHSSGHQHQHQKIHHKHNKKHDPNGNHEKLDVNPNDLKLNHAGTMLWYDGHFIDDTEILKDVKSPMKPSIKQNLLLMENVEGDVAAASVPSSALSLPLNVAIKADEDDDDDDDGIEKDSIEKDKEMKTIGNENDE